MNIQDSISVDSNNNSIYCIMVAIILTTVVLLLAWKSWTKRAQERCMGRSMRVYETMRSLG